MSNVLITGGNGFLGQRVVKLLLEKDISVTSVVRRGSVIPSFLLCFSNFQLIEVDDIFKLDEAEWLEILRGMDTIVHLAWYVKHPSFWHAIENVAALSASLRLVQAATHAGVRRFVGVGTCAEYQDQSEPLEIEMALAPKTLYASSKAALYFMLKSMTQQQEMSYAWCRLFFVYGYGEPSNKLYSYVIEKLKKREQVLIRNSQCVRDFIEVNDAAEQLVYCVLSDYVGPANICSGQATTIQNFVEHIATPYDAKGLLVFEQHGPADTIIGVRSCFQDKLR